MKCPVCGTEWPAEALFCGKCGTNFAQQKPQSSLNENNANNQTSKQNQKDFSKRPQKKSYVVIGIIGILIAVVLITAYFIWSMLSKDGIVSETSSTNASNISVVESSSISESTSTVLEDNTPTPDPLTSAKQKFDENQVYDAIQILENAYAESQDDTFLHVKNIFLRKAQILPEDMSDELKALCQKINTSLQEKEFSSTLEMLPFYEEEGIVDDLFCYTEQLEQKWPKNRWIYIGDTFDGQGTAIRVVPGHITFLSATWEHGIPNGTASLLRFIYDDNELELNISEFTAVNGEAEGDFTWAGIFIEDEIQSTQQITGTAHNGYVHGDMTVVTESETKISQYEHGVSNSDEGNTGYLSAYAIMTNTYERNPLLNLLNLEPEYYDIAFPPESTAETIKYTTEQIEKIKIESENPKEILDLVNYLGSNNTAVDVLNTTYDRLKAPDLFLAKRDLNRQLGISNMVLTDELNAYCKQIAAAMEMENTELIKTLLEQPEWTDLREVFKTEAAAEPLNDKLFWGNTYTGQGMVIICTDWNTVILHADWVDGLPSGDALEYNHIHSESNISCVSHNTFVNGEANGEHRRVIAFYTDDSIDVIQMNGTAQNSYLDGELDYSLNGQSKVLNFSNGKRTDASAETYHAAGYYQLDRYYNNYFKAFWGL